MFQVIPEPEFSAWYEALPEPIAEEVTTAIDLAASAEGLLAPERLSRLLLWFDGTGSGGGVSSGLGTIRLRNSLVAANSDNSGLAPDCAAGGLVSEQYNLIGNGTGCSFPAGTGD